MNIKLVEYRNEDKNEALIRISEFFGHHASLVTFVKTQMNVEDEMVQTLESWIEKGNCLYLIILDERTIGFVHIGLRGQNVAWIEDVFVDKNFRSKGIATQAIALAEDIIKSNEQYTSICMDVTPRNIDAMRLYQKLGYNNISIVTLRKELGDNPRDKKVEFNGMDFNI